MPKFAVIGLGRFGAQLAETLTQNGAEVIAIDHNREIVESIRDRVALAVRLDSTDIDALRAQGVDQVDAAVVGIGDDFESAVLTVSALKSFGVPRIICRAENEMRSRILAQVGADSTVNPEAESAVRWAHRLMLPDLKDYIELGEGHSIIQIPAPPAFFHKTPAELQIRQTYHLTLVAIKRVVRVQEGSDSRETETHTITIPEPDTKILPTDILVLVGSNESLNKIPRT